MVTFQGLKKAFDGHAVLDDVSFRVEDGSLCGLVAPNGAGKTTLLRIAADIVRPDGGTILYDGRDHRENEAIRQSRFFLPDEYYRLPQATLRGMAKFYGGYYPTWKEETFRRLVALFELDERKRLQGFSKGMQRQAYLTIALACRPRYLLLDETFDGLDPAKRSLVRRLLMEYIAETGASVLISSHNLAELESLCDQFVLLHDRRVALTGGEEELRGSMTKFRLLFDRAVSPDDFAGLDCRSFRQEDGAVTLIVRGDGEQAEAALRAMNPARLTSCSLTLEEIFLNETEAYRDDLTDLFE